MLFRTWLKRWRGLGKRSRPAEKRRRPRLSLYVEPLEDRVLLSLPDNPAFLLLDPSGAGALDVSGNASVQIAGGTAVVNSKSPSAVDVNGNGHVSVGELDIVGSPGRTVSGHGTIVGTVHA